MNKLSDEKRAMILKALVEGNSMRATARLTGTSGLTDRVWKIVELVPPNFVCFKLTHYPGWPVGSCRQPITHSSFDAPPSPPLID